MSEQKTEVASEMVILEKSETKTDRHGREYLYVVSAVQSPMKIDKQNDWTTEDEIQDALHEFAISLQKQSDPDESGLSYRHSRMVTASEAAVVELWQLKKEEQWGDKVLPKGTGMVGMRIYDPGYRQEINDGKITGISIEGFGYPVEEPLPQ